MTAFCIAAFSMSLISLIAYVNCAVGHIKCERHVNECEQRLSALERKVNSDGS